MSTSSRLVELLIKVGALTSVEAERVLETQQHSGAPLVVCVLRESGVDELRLQRILAQDLRLPVVAEERLLHLRLSPEMIERVPRNLAQASLALPLELDRTRMRVSVAMVDPSDGVACDRLTAAFVPLELRPCLARYSVLLRAIDVVYEQRSMAGVIGGTQAEIIARRVPTVAVREQRSWEDARTTVELIRGKVAVDASLAREMGVVPTADDVEAVRSEPLVMLPSLTTNVSGYEPPTAQWTVPHIDTDAGGDTLPKEAWEEEDRDHTVVRDLGPQLSETYGEADSLLWNLLASAGVLIAMLEERIDADRAHGRHVAHLARLVARELEFDELTIGRIAIAAQLFGLETVLRAELGDPIPNDVVKVFETEKSAPGGLNPTLRALGAHALGLHGATASEVHNKIAAVLQASVDCMALWNQFANQPKMLAGLRQRGTEPSIVRAIQRSLHRVIPGHESAR